jgi:predicted TIM-barrel fold metal-dependent hydrolase
LPDRICDPHHHLWLRPAMEYLATDLRADIATVPHVVRTVFVECDAWYRDDGPEHLAVVGETEWVVANGDAFIEAIVGAADLRLGALTEQALHAHVEAGAGRFRGIRQRATWDAGIKPSRPDPGPSLLLDPAFRRGFEVLHALGLGFDAWLYFPQLPELTDLARSYPDTTIVLNHLGAPITLDPYADRQATHGRWRQLMADVATCPNVFLKLGGIGMPMFGSQWYRDGGNATIEQVAAEWSEPIRFCIDTFGPDRCMFESNFPVDKISMSYATLWAAFDAISAGYSPSERDALFHDTAVRAYRLRTKP